MKAKRMGIWMDHEQAHLTEFTQEPMKTTTIFSKFNHAERQSSLAKGENHMHSKEQHQEGEYYKELGKRILQCTEVVVFGPTNAKNELVNSLQDDRRFVNVKISSEATGKMTQNQVQAFVRSYFSKH